MTEALKRLFRFDSDQIRRYVEKRRQQYPDLSNAELARRISTRKSVKNGLLSAGTGVFGVMTLPITITADAFKCFRAEAFLFKCINHIYGIDPDDEVVNALFPLIIGADSIAEFEGEIDAFLDAFWGSEENQSFMVNSLKKSAMKAVVKQVPEFATKFTIHQFGAGLTQQLLKGIPKQLSKMLLRSGGRKFTQRVAARSLGKAIPLVGAATGFAMDYYSIREKGKLAIQFNEEGILGWACDLFSNADPQIEKIADAPEANNSLIYIHSDSVFETDLSWIDKLRQSGWQGSIYHCWWDTTQIHALELAAAEQMQRSRLDFKKQSKVSELIGSHFLPEFVKHAINTPSITLMGHALGANAALNSLKAWDASLPTIKDVVLLGATIDDPPTAWSHYSSKVSGRIVNAYNVYDPSLNIVGQFQSEGEVICGLAPIPVAQVVNLDSSEKVGKSHRFDSYLDSFLAKQAGQVWG
ncbi:MAG: DUF726 domain-containing protein [Spirulina sp. SIO3F2]|nr:DUF726 domain-containing protein [Spirulina sp. SIO3F2]